MLRINVLGPKQLSSKFEERFRALHEEFPEIPLDIAKPDGDLKDLKIM